MTDRKLASIQTIIRTIPIDGADKIEIAFVLGWQVVVAKGEFKAGDLVVFYEIDAFLSADDPRYESFKERFTTWNNKQGMRLKSIKLRKTLSQGLVLPVSKFPEIINPKEGQDVTELLKIEKWEVFEKSSSPNAAGSFPSFIPKTDQERIQNCGRLVEGTLNDSYEVTVKKDGSSMTVFNVVPNSPYYNAANKNTKDKQTLFWKVKNFLFGVKKESVFGICSRNILLKNEGESNFHKAVEKYSLGCIKQLKRSFAIQGELVAPDIQQNYEKVSDIEFHVFDVFDIDKQEYLLPEQRRNFVEALGLKHITVVSSGVSLKDFIDFKEGDNLVNKCLDIAEGKGDNKGVMREGLVFKNETKKFSFKAISNSYLFKTGK